MADELPYFKFKCSEWNDGDITLCSMEAQGLFINLCSMYWSQEGHLSITKAKRRYYDCNTSVWDELISEGIIKVDQDQLKISFLDEQFQERRQRSEQNSKNVSKRWKKYETDTTVSNSYYEEKTLVYNKEKKREEKRREELENLHLGNYYQSAANAFTDMRDDELFLENLLLSLSQNGFKTCTKVILVASIKAFLTDQMLVGDYFEKNCRSEVKRHLGNWLRKIGHEKLTAYAKSV